MLGFLVRLSVAVGIVVGTVWLLFPAFEEEGEKKKKTKTIIMEDGREITTGPQKKEMKLASLPGISALKENAGVSFLVKKIISNDYLEQGTQRSATILPEHQADISSFLAHATVVDGVARRVSSKSVKFSNPEVENVAEVEAENRSPYDEQL